MALKTSLSFQFLDFENVYFRIENIKFLDKTQVRAMLSAYLTQEAAQRQSNPISQKLVTINYDMNSSDNLYVQFYNAVKATEEYSGAIDVFEENIIENSSNEQQPVEKEENQ